MAKKKVLICDDEEAVRESLNLIISDNHDVEMVCDGKECIDKIKQNAGFDLVFLDVKMPGANGLEVLKQIRKLRPNLKVIFATGYRSTEIAAEAIKLGASDYIIKPFESKDVREVVARVIG